MNFREYVPFYKRNLKVAVPVMLTQAGQVAVQLTDNIMVGHLGTAQLAGVSFANSIIVLGMVFGIGFTQGVTPHVGQSFGKGEHGRVGLLLQNSLILNSITAIALTIVMFLASLLMNSLGQPEIVVGHAKDFYHIMLPAMFPFLMFFCIRQFSEGIGITKYAMYITILGNLLNIFLNWVLIFGHLGLEPMGVKGSATASLISRYIMLICFIILLFKVNKYNRYLKFFTKPLIRPDIVKKILSTSVPLSIQNLVEITAFSLSAIMVGWNGAVSLASHQVAMSMSSFSFMIALGVGAAATIRVSHQYGYGDFRSLRIAGFAAIHLNVLIMSLFGIAYTIFRKDIPYLFTNDPEVELLASRLLIIAALYQIFDAIQLSCLACLRALSDVRIPLMLSIISYYFICLPLGYLCGTVFHLGAIGVWIGLLLGLLFAALLFLWRFNKLSYSLLINQNK